MRCVPANEAVSATTIEGAKSTGGLATSTEMRDLGGMVCVYVVVVIGELVVWRGRFCGGAVPGLGCIDWVTQGPHGQ